MEQKNGYRKNTGITLIALSILVLVLLILAAITISTGMETIEKAKLEELRTNMLLIQAKARESVEEATFKMGINPDENKKNQVRNEIYIEKAGLEKAEDVPSNFGITDTSTCYWLTNLASWGLNEIKTESGERYLVQFNETDVTVEVYNTKGYKGNYSLTQIDQL